MGAVPVFVAGTAFGMCWLTMIVMGSDCKWVCCRFTDGMHCHGVAGTAFGMCWLTMIVMGSDCKWVCCRFTDGMHCHGAIIGRLIDIDIDEVLGFRHR